MPLQEPRDREFRHDIDDDYHNTTTFHDGAGLADVRQRLQPDGVPGEDLFLSLALNESDFSDDKRQSLPPRSILRSSRLDRPRSSGGLVGPSHDRGFPAQDILEQRRPRHNTLSSPSRQEATEAEQGRGATPTPSQYAPRDASYLSRPSPAASLYDRSPREWPASSESFHTTARRGPSSTFSEAVSRKRLTRMNSLDVRRAAHQREDTLLTPHTPAGQRRSDPETESIGSATAPSTVWDELDDLKSRIKNLELTGKAPSTSAAAIAHQSGERPRTATTAPTTISSSPQHVRKANPVPSDVTIGGPAAGNVHPLLHSALVKAKPLLSPPLYRALEATAADALALAAMASGSGPQGTAYSAASIISSVSVSDRHIRRKADSMCRNLTDLCIALCEGKTELVSPTTTRPTPTTTPRVAGETPPSRYVRRSSVEPEDHTLRKSPSRTFTRLENRRSSLLGLGLNSASSPRENSEQYANQDSSPGQNHVDYAARYNRPVSTVRSRTSRFDDQYDDPTIRAPSRAMTDLSQLRTRRNDHTSGLQPRSPGLREALTARRSSGIPEERVDDYAESPTSETGQVKARDYLERHVAPASEAGGLAPIKRRRRITSIDQYPAPSPRLSELGNVPMRTTSLSRRRNLVVD